MIYVVLALLICWIARSIVLSEPLPQRPVGVDDEEWKSTVFGVRTAQWCPMVSLLSLFVAPFAGFILGNRYQNGQFWWMWLLVAIGTAVPLRGGEMLVARRGKHAVKAFQSEVVRGRRFGYHAFRRVLLLVSYSVAIVSLIALLLGAAPDRLAALSSLGNCLPSVELTGC